MRIIITGATGFVGKNLVITLYSGMKNEKRRGDPGHAKRSRDEIICIARKKNADTEFLEKHGARVDIGNLSDKEFLKKELKGSDVVIHLAAALHNTGNMKDMFTTNVSYTKNITEACMENQKLIFMSSVAIFGKCIHADEMTEPRPDNEYGKSKLLAERIVRKYDNHIILRPSIIFGKLDKNFSKIFKLIKERKYVTIGDGKNIIQPLYIDDLSKIINMIIHSDLKNEIFVIAGKKISLEEFTGLIAKNMMVRTNNLRIPKNIAKIFISIHENTMTLFGLRPFITVDGLNITETRIYDTSKAERMLGLRKTPIEEAIRKTIE